MIFGVLAKVWDDSKYFKIISHVYINVHIKYMLGANLLKIGWVVWTLELIGHMQKLFNNHFLNAGDPKMDISNQKFKIYVLHD